MLGLAAQRTLAPAAVARPASHCSSRGIGAARRGSALFLVLVLTIVLAALGLSALFLSSEATVVEQYRDRDSQLRYAADAALQMGKSRLNADANILPATGYVQLVTNGTIVGADGQTVPGLTVNVWGGPTGVSDRAVGRVSTVVAQVTDNKGAKYVRRLELVQQSFAKYAYWSDDESGICFGASDHLYGPVWSNDDISTCAGQQATFHDSVASAQNVYNNAGAGGVFMKSFQQLQAKMSLPNTTQLAQLTTLAGLGNLAFVAPNPGATNMDDTRIRIEFVNVDLNNDGDATDADEGFLRVYTVPAGMAAPAAGAWVRGDYQGANCGTFFRQNGGAQRFMPYTAAMAQKANVKTLLTDGGMTSGNANLFTNNNPSLQKFMYSAGNVANTSARCFPGGSEFLNPTTTGAGQTGGSATTFRANDGMGSWMPWPGAVSPALAAKRPDAAYLFPLSTALNPGFTGVISVNGQVAVSGTLRGRVTLYATGNVSFVDNMYYATTPDPASNQCFDIMGIVSGGDIMPADNALLVPQNTVNPGNNQNVQKTLGTTTDTWIYSTVMALGNSWGAQNYNVTPANVSAQTVCGTTTMVRGCLYLYGSLIQKQRKAVSQNGGGVGTGYAKRYSYDRCVLQTPPPYFPVTGRFVENRYYEMDPQRFNLTTLFTALQPGP